MSHSCSISLQVSGTKNNLDRFLHICQEDNPSRPFLNCFNKKFCVNYFSEQSMNLLNVQSAEEIKELLYAGAGIDLPEASRMFDLEMDVVILHYPSYFKRTYSVIENGKILLYQEEDLRKNAPEKRLS